MKTSRDASRGFFYAGCENLHDAANIGTHLFENYNLPFQVIGVLILVASIGVVVLSKRELK